MVNELFCDRKDLSKDSKELCINNQILLMIYFIELQYYLFQLTTDTTSQYKVYPGCPHIYHDEKSRQYQEYQEEFSGNIKTFSWNYFINSLGKHAFASNQYDFLHQSRYFVIVAAET